MFSCCDAIPQIRRNVFWGANASPVRPLAFSGSDSDLTSGYRERSYALAKAEGVSNLSVGSGVLSVNGAASMRWTPPVRPYTNRLVQVSHNLTDAIVDVGWFNDFDHATPVGAFAHLGVATSPGTSVAFGDWPTVPFDHKTNATHAILQSQDPTGGTDDWMLLLRLVSGSDWYVLGFILGPPGYQKPAQAGFVVRSGAGELLAIATGRTAAFPEMSGVANPSSGETFDGFADQAVNTTFGTGSNGDVHALEVRRQDADNLWRYEFQKTAASTFDIRVIERSSGSNSTRATLSGVTIPTVDNGNTARIRVTGREHYFHAIAADMTPSYLGRYVQSADLAQDAAVGCKVSWTGAGEFIGVDCIEGRLTL